LAERRHEARTIFGPLSAIIVGRGLIDEQQQSWKEPECRAITVIITTITTIIITTINRRLRRIRVA
jgi:hypothetical protein